MRKSLIILLMLLVMVLSFKADALMYSSILDSYTIPGISNSEKILNIRAATSLTAEIVGRLPAGGGCEVLARNGAWYKIKSGNISGYVLAEFIDTGHKASTVIQEKQKLMLKSNSYVLHVYASPSELSELRSILNSKGSYEVISQLNSGWIQLAEGYVKMSDDITLLYSVAEAYMYLPASNSSNARETVVAYAKQFLGNQYVWGGTDLNNGADCSGFLQSCMMDSIGVNIPRASRDQAKAGTSVSPQEMRPGDLIFYGTDTGYINHVAMYIGEEMIIHAASSATGIRTSRWDYRRPIAIVDVIGD